MMRRLALWLARNRVVISTLTVLAYLVVLLPATIILFPDSNLWLGLLVLVIGLLDELKDLADDIREQDAPDA
jgi:hypothetical protein